jgi:hypothetical protein
LQKAAEMQADALHNKHFATYSTLLVFDALLMVQP